MQISGIQGDSANKTYKGAVDAQAFCFGGSGAADDGVFTIEKGLDSATVPLLEHLKSGQVIDSVTVTVLRSSGQGMAPSPASQSKIEKVVVRGYRMGGHDSLSEDVSFQWETARITSYDRNGTALPAVQVQAPATVQQQTTPVCDATTTNRSPGAVDSAAVFLKVPGVQGDSLVNKGASDATAFCFGVAAERNATNLLPLTLGKPADRASAQLASDFRTGELRDGVKVLVTKPSQSDPILEYTVANSALRAMRSGGRGDALHEDLAYAGNSVSITVRSVRPGGALNPPQSVQLSAS